MKNIRHSRIKIGLVLLALWPVFHINAQTSDWISLDEGVGCDDFGAYSVYHLFADTVTNNIYASGNFGHDGYCNEMRTIGKWNGQEWEAMGSSATIGAMSSVRYNNQLIASGPFIWDEITGNIENQTCVWDGSEWDIMAEGPDRPILNFMEHNGKLYAAGKFERCGSSNSGIGCVYDGENWEPLEIVSEFNGFTGSVTEYQDKIYFGGVQRFTNGLGEYIYHLCYYDGEHYRPVGQGMQEYVFGAVNDIVSYKDTLYIGGQIRLPGHEDTYWMVTFDGDSLRPANPMPTDEVVSLMVHDGALYASGGFTEIGGVEAEHLARYDGEEWIAINTDSMFANGGYYMGYQFSRGIQDMVVMDDTLYAGGLFYRFNQDTVRSVAKLNKNLTTDFPPPATHTVEKEQVPFRFNLFPNPSTGSLTFSWFQPSAGEVRFRITDARGRVVVNSPSGQYSEGKHEETLSLGHLSGGAYLIRLITPSGTATERWLKME